MSHEHAIDIVWRAAILGAMWVWVEKLVAERKVLMAAPGVSSILVAACLTAGFVVANWHNEGTISSLREGKGAVDERLKVRDEQILALQARVDASSPEDIGKKIESLQNTVDSLRTQVANVTPVRLSADQKTKMNGVLSSVKQGVVEISIDSNANGKSALVGELRELFSHAGWKVYAGLSMGMVEYPPSGIGVYVRNRIVLSESEGAVLRALTAANVQYDIVENPKQDVPSVTVTERLH